MHSPEGSAFWELIKISGSELRIGGMGVVLGFDSISLLRLAEIKQIDLAVVAELLPFANAGLLSSLKKKNKDNEDGN